MTTTVLITGGCGFIGHHVVEHIFRKTDWDIIVIDKLTYASMGLKRLRNAELLNKKRIKVFTFDLSNPITHGVKLELGQVDIIIHMAADTHVDNSIKDPVPFIHNNVMSTVHMLEFARSQKNLKMFFYFSTDEVFGAAPDEVSYKEWDRHNPTNPYSASKSAAENICLSYENTYKIPVIIANVMNAFGERQHVEKFIPKVMKYILEGRQIDIHADKTCTKPGSRFYIHARNIAAAVFFLLEKGQIGDKYNIVGEKEVNNLEMAQFIAKEMKTELKYQLVNFHENRPGHDQRYALDGQKMKELGWQPPVGFEESLRKTIRWTLYNREWLKE